MNDEKLEEMKHEAIKTLIKEKKKEESAEIKVELKKEQYYSDEDGNRWLKDDESDFEDE